MTHVGIATDKISIVSPTDKPTASPVLSEQNEDIDSYYLACLQTQEYYELTVFITSTGLSGAT